MNTPPRAIFIAIACWFSGPCISGPTSDAWIGKTVPAVTLADGTIYRSATFRAISPESITIETAGERVTIPANALTMDARVALGIASAADDAEIMRRARAANAEPAAAPRVEMATVTVVSVLADGLFVRMLWNRDYYLVTGLPGQHVDGAEILLSYVASGRVAEVAMADGSVATVKILEAR